MVDRTFRVVRNSSISGERATRLLFGLLLLGVFTSEVLAGVRLSEPADDDRPFSVRCRLKVNGKIQTATQGGEAIGLSMSVDAKLSFFERRLPSGGKDALGLRSLRNYDLAEASIDIGGRETTNRLRKELKTVVVEGQPSGIRRYALAGQMDYDSLELLNTPADSLAVSGLLPPLEVDQASKWDVPHWVIPLLTGVDAVAKSTLKCSIERLDTQYAVIKIVGKVEGATQGALTKIDVEGQIAYDLKKKHVRQARIVQREERAVGVVSPGMKVTATMYIDKQPTAVDGGLTAKLIDSVPINTPDDKLNLQFTSRWSLGFAIDRDWHIFHQTNDVAVLRLVRNGSLIAQCNVTPLAKAPPGRHTSERQFQEDIAKALGAQLHRIRSADQLKTQDGRFVYRVIAAGQSRNVDMLWLYYLCAAPDGRQSVLVFSVENKMLERLGNRPTEIVKTVTFGTQRTAAQSIGPRKN